MGLSVRRVRGLALSCLILGGILVGAGCVTLASSGPAVAQTVSSIVVEGSRRVEPETIRSYFKPGPGGRIGPEQEDEALKALVATGLFSDVRISHSGGRVVVTVVENPVINRVAFEGNKKAKDEQLTAEVQSKPRGTLSRPTVQADVQRIIEIYHRTGRFDVSVTPKIIELPNNRVDLVFEITEGEKTGVKDIRFVGASAYSYSRLKDVIKTSESNWLSFLQTTDIYDPDRVEADRDLLRRFYLKHGYADVRIVSAVGEYDPARKGFIVTFTIDEGAQYRVGNIEVISNVRAIDPQDLRSQLRLSTGSVYNADLVEKSVELMTVQAAKHGYAFANVRPRGERNFETKTINIVFVVEEGARAYIERINIRGNTRTRDYVIRREFDLGEGDAYNRALVDRAERRLKNLGFFKTVKITSEPGSTPDRVIVNVEVEEQNTGDFSVSGGYSTSDGFIGEVTVGERNLFGSGLYARASGRFGEFTKAIELSLTEPYLMGSRVSGGISLFAKQSETSSFQSFGSETYGGTLTLGTPITEQVGAQYRYSLYRQRITLDPALTDCSATNPAPGCLANGEASVPVKQAALAGAAWVSSIGYTLSYNTLDNVRNPTSGMRSDFRQDLAGLGGDVKFLKSTEDFRYYHEVAGDTVAMLRAQGGYVTPWGGQQLPLLNSFFGGPDLVRGFAVNGFGPRDITDGTSKDNIGGTRYWATTAELRTPIPWIPPETGLRFSVFADAGSLWGFAGSGSTPALSQSLKVADSKTIRSSMGAGLIWDSPFGPMRVDYAYPTSKAAFDVTQRLRL